MKNFRKLFQLKRRNHFNRKTIRWFSQINEESINTEIFAKLEQDLALDQMVKIENSKS